MANNRLYIVDKVTKEYVMIAKGWGCAWLLWKHNELEDFLYTRTSDNDEVTNLLIGHENDEEFYNEFIVNGENYNQ